MFEEIDLKVGDSQKQIDTPLHFSYYCSNSSCAGTSLHYCC